MVVHELIINSSITLHIPERKLKMRKEKRLGIPARGGGKLEEENGGRMSEA